MTHEQLQPKVEWKSVKVYRLQKKKTLYLHKEEEDLHICSERVKQRE